MTLGEPGIAFAKTSFFELCSRQLFVKDAFFRQFENSTYTHLHLAISPCALALPYSKGEQASEPLDRNDSPASPVLPLSRALWAIEQLQLGACRNFPMTHPLGGKNLARSTFPLHARKFDSVSRAGPLTGPLC
jgi:hypothetical protein